MNYQKKLLLFIVLIIFLAPSFSNNRPYLGGGIAGSIPTISFPIKSEPSNISGFRASLQAYSPRFRGRRATLFLDFSYASWFASQSSISIVALAPILRYQSYEDNSKILNPFIDLSVGSGYLSKTMFARNNLGIHYTFQDMIGLGFKFGKNNNTTLSWRIIHYSNARLSKYNRGITIPIILALDYHI